ncbi:glycoside hydrolase family 3 protein [Mycobacterium sp. MYCO198283]|uniref:glycoside hydrolase family 3 N-terminal domain-containing protein n=1 Tax=Mycobacterium sp. MYCO198283 TaxID=2883505 RepID=UPI001E36AAF0|nr:glycoside hydrolase family 3 N-terminal domain-containing protein [Mycobacterium sp. MYCO198283]MCG5432038.1 glycoside hydrolase family 3 protein [Mycobacterium sp. MYCO198283]
MAVTRTIVTPLAAAAVLLGCSPDSAGPQAAPEPPTPAATSAATRPVSTAMPVAPPAGCVTDLAGVAALPLRDRVAQLLMVGVTGADDARAVVSEHHVGGIFVGSWTDLSLLGAPLAEIADAAGPLPLAVSVDEEGGRVSRLAGLIGSQPSARVLAATKTPEEVRGIAAERGRAMRALGITVDFAPVVDVTDAPDDTVIGDRSFGSDPATVTRYAHAYAQGLSDAGVTPVLKHFPGHGHASGDSHAQGVVSPDLAQLKAVDLVPYRELTTLPGVAVMVGHLQVPGLTGGDPASLSPAAYGLLRSGGYGGPGFPGVVFTDDLSSMRAVSDRYGVADAALKSLQAGADVALWVTTAQVPAVVDRLAAAVKAGELDEGKVNSSVLKLALSRGARC